MNYVDPASVISPKHKVSNVEVIHDGGEHSWSAAKLTWENNPVVGLRWNGSYDSETTKGMPQSRGYPTWFIVPEELQKYVLEYCTFYGSKSDPKNLILPPSLESIYDTANTIREQLKVKPLPDLRAIFDDASAEWQAGNSSYEQKINELKRIADSGLGELAAVYDMYSMMYIERQDIIARFPYAILQLLECLLRKK